MGLEGAVFMFALFVGIVLLFIIISAIKIFVEFERGVRFRLGKFVDVIGPGLVIVYPLIDSVVKVDLRTKLLDVPRQDVITKDNATVAVDAIIYYKVVDAKKVILEVEDFQYAIIKLAQTTLRSIIGEMSLDDVLSRRDYINTRLRDVLDSASDAWGVRAESVEIREVQPPKDIQEAMTRQMSAERTKRALVLEAEGIKQAQVLKAEGERDAEIARAEGERKAKILVAEGEAKAIETVATSAQENLKGQAVLLWQLKVIEEIGKAPNTKNYILPSDLIKTIESLGVKLSGEK